MNDADTRVFNEKENRHSKDRDECPVEVLTVRCNISAKRCQNCCSCLEELLRCLRAARTGCSLPAAGTNCTAGCMLRALAALQNARTGGKLQAANASCTAGCKL